MPALSDARNSITIASTVAVGAIGFAWATLRYVNWLASDPKPLPYRRPW